ncbi:MAG: hypothetical protein IH961_10935 [Chloroflexi bacterium]|nr:hypothetical protein [Chloroflexota bacterium]
MAGTHMIEVAEQLLEKARRGDLAWAGPTNKDAYYLRLPDGMSLAISPMSWLPGPPVTPPGLPELPDLRRVSIYGYRLELFEEKGPMIGSLAATVGDPEYSTLLAVYELAQDDGDDSQVKIEKALNYLKGTGEPPNSHK